MKYKEIKSADRVLKQLLTTPMEQRLSYRLSKLLGKFVPALDKIEEQGNELVRKHGELNNGRYNVAPDKMESFTAEFMAFLDNDIEINFEPIPFEMIEKTGIKISPEDMIALEQFITEPEAEEVA